jgi:hypothetical protein
MTWFINLISHVRWLNPSTHSCLLCFSTGINQRLIQDGRWSLCTHALRVACGLLELLFISDCITDCLTLGFFHSLMVLMMTYMYTTNAHHHCHLSVEIRLIKLIIEWSILFYFPPIDGYKCTLMMTIMFAIT